MNREKGRVAPVANCPPPIRNRSLVSNPNKVFWPEEGYTKLDLVRFYYGGLRRS